jgi:hypothetical protein
MKFSELIVLDETIESISDQQVEELFNLIYSGEDMNFWTLSEIAKHLWGILFRAKYDRKCEIKKCRSCGKQYAASFTDGQTIELIEYPGRKKVDLCNACSKYIHEDLMPVERAEVETKEQIMTEMFSDVKEGVTWPPNQKQPTS